MSESHVMLQPKPAALKGYQMLTMRCNRLTVAQDHTYPEIIVHGETPYMEPVSSPGQF